MSSHHSKRRASGAAKLEHHEEAMMLVSAGATHNGPPDAREAQAATTLASAWRGHAERAHHADEPHAAGTRTTSTHSKWSTVRPSDSATRRPSEVAPTAKSPPKKGNPAVVGLTGFAMTTMLLQLHNLGVCSIGPVLALGVIYGGGAQLVAGLQEFACGNNFGYSAFTSYGAFWISFGIILFCNDAGIYVSDDTDIGCYLALWGVYTAMMFVVSWRIHTMMSVTFLTLMLGFFGLSIAHFVHAPWLTVASACDLMLCACCAWYMMLAALFEQAFGGPVLPLGKPWIPDTIAIRLRGDKDVTLPQLMRKLAALASTHKT